MDAVKEPAIRIPKAYRGYARLVAIPESDYKRLVDRERPVSTDPAHRAALWEQVVGMWADRDDLDPIKYQRELRKEWGKRAQRQWATVRSSLAKSRR